MYHLCIYFTWFCIMWHSRSDQNRNENKKWYMLFHCCSVLIPHYHALLRSPSASTFDWSLIKGNWIYFCTLLIWEIRKWSTNTDNLGFSLCECSYYGNITSKHSQFYYWHSKKQIFPGSLCFTRSGDRKIML